MANYANLNLVGKRPINTYQYLMMQSASIVTDGLGDTMPDSVALQITSSCTISASYSLSASYEIIFEESSSHADWTDTSSFSITSSWTNKSSATTLETSSFYYITSSWAESSSRAISASWADASPATILETASIYPITASQSISASWAPYIDTDTGTVLYTASIYDITSSWANNVVSSSYSLSSSYPWFQTGSNIAYMGGNVGIGTSSTVNRLDVVGNISCSVITASLEGTASWADNSAATTLFTASLYGITSSHAITASWADKSIATILETASIYYVTASCAITASYASECYESASIIQALLLRIEALEP